MTTRDPNETENDAPLDQQRRAMDDVFFGVDDDRSLVEQLRLRLREEAAKEEIAAASGITDPHILSELAGLGIRADTLAALTLIPLIQVAWADGVMEDRERDAILDGAASTGIRPGSPSHQLLRVWMQDPPPPVMQKAWTEFITGLRAELSSPQATALHQNILGRARKVAEAAGDLLGHGTMVSPEEEAVLQELEGAFTA